MIRRQSMKADGGVQTYRPSFLTTTVGGSDRSIKAPSSLHQGKHTRHKFSRSLSGSQGLPGNYGAKKNLLPLPGIALLFLRYPVSNTVTTLNKLSWFL